MPTNLTVYGDIFSGNCYKIADISLNAYTHVADEGGFDLSDCPATVAWLQRVAAQPGHLTMAQLSGA